MQKVTIRNLSPIKVSRVFHSNMNNFTDSGKFKILTRCYTTKDRLKNKILITKYKLQHVDNEITTSPERNETQNTRRIEHMIQLQNKT